MVKLLRAAIVCIMLIGTLGTQVVVVAQDIGTPAETEQPDPGIEPTVEVPTAVPPTAEIIPTDIPSTEKPPTESPTILPAEDIQPTPDKDIFRAAVAISGAITGVTVDPDTLPSPGARMTMNVAWAVPDTAIAGDTFTLALDPRLSVADDDFPLQNGNGDTVAIASLRNGVVTFTLTEFANSNVGISGTAFFFGAFRNGNSLAGQAVNLNFTSNSGETFSDVINVPARPTPTAGPSPTVAPTPTPNPNSSKSGSFARADQGKVNPDNALNWTVNGPTGPQSQVTIVDVVPDGAAWLIDCGTVTVNLGGVVDCSPNAITVTFTAVAAGERPQVKFKGDVTGTQVPGQLRSFPNSATVTSDGGSATRTANLNQTSGGGGGGTGNNPTPTPIVPTPTPLTPTPTPITPTPTPPLVSVTPINPTIAQAVCRFGAVTAPRVTLPANNAAVTYSISGNVVAGGTVVVTAALGSGYTWERTSVPGWSFSGRTATFSVTLDDPACTPVSPVLPTLTQAVCNQGVISRPRATLPANTAGITYTKSGNEVAGGTITVTASLAQGFSWADTSIPGWTFTPTAATRTVTFDEVECLSVLPEVPVITQAVCTGGVLSFPDVTQPANTEGIVYTRAGDEVPGGQVVITATLQPGYSWASTTLDDWVFTPSRATFTVNFDQIECIETAPVQPIVTQAACVLGSVSRPAVIQPEDTDGVVYTRTGEETAGGTVVITATLQDGFAWAATDLAGWVFSTDSATFSVLLDDPDCGITNPVLPDITQAACASGVITSPTVYLPTDTDAIAYDKSGAEVSGGSVVVTADLKDGFAWEDTSLAGWSFTPAQATLTIELDNPGCTPVSPGTIDTTQATCDFGAVNPPVVLVPANTTELFYTVSGDIVPGGTVVITAYLEDGYEWIDQTIPGWVYTDSSATYTLTLDPAGCTPADPGLAIVTEGSCVDGSLVLPVVTLPENSDAVTYSKSGNEVPGGTVIITATLNPGFAWSESPVDGWSYTTPSASYAIQLADVGCEEVLPVAPTIEQATCLAGEVTGVPAVILAANTDAITYAKSGDEVLGGTVVVTATLNQGFSWAQTDLEGWTFPSPTTATFSTTFVTPDCSSNLTPGNGRGKTPQGVPFTGSLVPLVDNPNGDRLIFGPGTGPAHGSVTIDPNGNYVYTPDPDFCGTDSFTYTVRTAETAAVIGTVTIEVTCEPVATKPGVAVTSLPQTGTRGDDSTPGAMIVALLTIATLVLGAAIGWRRRSHLR